MADPLAQALKDRVKGLFEARPDLTPAEFAVQILRGRSWVSEFLNGKRTTDSLRLVIRIARVFGVPVAYLLGERERTLDPGAATLLATWDDLTPPYRDALLKVAASYRPLASSTGGGAPSSSDAPEATPTRTRSATDEPPKRRR